MGEYAKHNGEQVKIGTCEEMYYLRADQRDQIEDYDFDSCLSELRFRFPFPDEDKIEPGQFEQHDRGVKIPGWILPEDYTHDGSVQFTAQPGYLVSLPCAESAAFAATGLRVHRNGWRGGYEVRQQKFVDGAWWLVIACGSCGEKWRLPLEVAQTVAAAFESEAMREEYRRDFETPQRVHGVEHQRSLFEMAKRIRSGYALVEVAS